MEKSKENEEEIINSLDDGFIIDSINEYLPTENKITTEKGAALVSEAKNLFFNLKGLKGFKPTEQDFNLGIEFFNEAKKDLNRSKKSYSDKDFSDSIYHLQQTAEKIMKAYGLVQGVFTKKDLFDIQHKTPKAFIKLAEEKNIQAYLKSLKQLSPHLNTDISGLKKIVDTKDKELALLDADKLRIWLNLSKKIDENLSKTNIDNILEKALPELAKMQGKEITYPNFSIMKFSSTFIKMYLIAAMTYPHEAYTRYPDRSIKPTKYTKKLGIVQVAPEIFKILDESLDSLNKFMGWKNNNRNKSQTN